MPTPQTGEEQDKFISRCIRELRREGKHEMKAILGKCYGIWRGKHGGEPPKKEK